MCIKKALYMHNKFWRRILKIKEVIQLSIFDFVGVKTNLRVSDSPNWAWRQDSWYLKQSIVRIIRLCTEKKFIIFTIFEISRPNLLFTFNIHKLMQKKLTQRFVTLFGRSTIFFRFFLSHRFQLIISLFLDIYIKRSLNHQLFVKLGAIGSNYFNVQLITLRWRIFTIAKRHVKRSF